MCPRTVHTNIHEAHTLWTRPPFRNARGTQSSPPVLPSVLPARAPAPARAHLSLVQTFSFHEADVSEGTLTMRSAWGGALVCAAGTSAPISRRLRLAHSRRDHLQRCGVLTPSLEWPSTGPLHFPPFAPSKVLASHTAHPKRAGWVRWRRRPGGDRGGTPMPWKGVLQRPPLAIKHCIPCRPVEGVGGNGPHDRKKKGGEPGCHPAAAVNHPSPRAVTAGDRHTTHPPPRPSLPVRWEIRPCVGRQYLGSSRTRRAAFAGHAFVHTPTSQARE